MSKKYYDPDKDPHMNPGVRLLVKFLRSHGFETVDSGDGTSAYDTLWYGDTEVGMAYVHCKADSRVLVEEAQRMHDLLVDAGVQFDYDPMDDLSYKGIQATYSPIDKIATISLIGILDKDVYAFNVASSNFDTIN